MTPTERRAERQETAVRAAIGRPTVWSPRLAELTMSPFTRRALAGQLPAKVVR